MSAAFFMYLINSLRFLTVAGARTPLSYPAPRGNERDVADGTMRELLVDYLRRVTPRTFRAVVTVGHKDTHVVIVPFDPSVVWPGYAPVTLSREDDPRGGHGWPVSGTIDGQRFVGFVGRRYGRSYVILPAAFRTSGAIDEGDEVEVTVSPRSIAVDAGS
jgi:hypothetical protein